MSIGEDHDSDGGLASVGAGESPAASMQTTRPAISLHRSVAPTEKRRMDLDA
jgi:hypothetical protein